MKITSNKRIQKILFYAFLIASASIIIASLCFVHRSWTMMSCDKNATSDSFWITIQKAINSTFQGPPKQQAAAKEFFGCDKAGMFAKLIYPLEENGVPFYRNVWFNIQSVNNFIFYSGLVMLVLTAICGIVGCFSRKKYYVSNLVCSVGTGTTGIILSILMIVKSLSLKSDLEAIQSDVDIFYSLKNFLGSSDIEQYGEFSTSNCLIGVIVPIIFMVFCIALILFGLFKYLETRKINKEAVING